MAVRNKTLNVVAVGASAGGVEALGDFAAGLPPDLPYAVLVALHMPAGAPSVLARILDRKGPLAAKTAVEGAHLEAGTIHVAVPGRHLLADDHRMILSQGPTENGHRPAVNALFRSVALNFGHRAVSIVLSGVLDDGTLGSAAIRMRGGTTIAQAPSDALFPTMPENAIHAGLIDHEVAAAEMGGLLKQLADREFEEPTIERDPRMELESYTCPDCNGSLISISEGNYRCHVGHAWTADALLGERDHELEGALWVAMRSLQEKANLPRRMARQVKPGTLRDKYDALAGEAERATSVLGDRLADAYARHRESNG